jgi:hypothetical protein
MNQYRVQRGVEGCDVAQLRMGRGSVRVQCAQFSSVLSKVRRGSVRVRHGSVPAAAQFRVQCGSVRVRCGSVQGAAWLSCRVLRGSVDRVRRGSVSVQHDSVQGAA